MTKPVVLGISGASGITLGIRMLRRLVECGEEVFLIVTKDASLTAVHEMGHGYVKPESFVKDLTAKQKKQVTVCKIQDFTSPIASGSFLTKGMCIVPCSMATLAAISTGLSDNLLRRAADVTLKERRPLLISPREAPFNRIHLEHMAKLSQMGAIIHPPIPAWYMRPNSLDEAEEFIVNRMLDALPIDNVCYDRYS